MNIFNIKRVAMAAVIAVLALGVTQVKAQEPKADLPQIHQALKAMVTAQGYTISEEGKFREGWEYFFIKVPYNGTSYNVRLNLSSGGTRLWFTVAMANLTPEQQQDPVKLRRLLELPIEMGTTRIVYHPSFGGVTVELSVPVNGCTPEEFRDRIQEILSNIDAHKADLM